MSESPKGTKGKQKLITYVAEATPKLFHASNKFIRGIMGPFGSGKSSACVVEIFLRAREQRPYNGIRRTRWAIIRNTYPELISTSLKTWDDWVPHQICPVSRGSPITGRMKQRLPDDTIVDMEVIFLALDRDDDVRKLKSLELTGAWLNEASEIPESVFKTIQARVDRFPSKRDGGASWTGVIMDTNPPDDESWWYRIAEVEKPLESAFFKQPPAILKVPQKDPKKPSIYVPNPKAENVQNHNSGYVYWLRLVPGKDPEWIKVYLMGQYGTVIEGKPVYSEYVDTIHYSDKPLKLYRGLPLIVGWDFGLNPTAVFCQISPRGRFMVIDELVGQDIALEQFCKTIYKPHIENYYHGIPIIAKCDPAGKERAQTDETTCIQILNEQGIDVDPAHTQNFLARREAVASYLNRMIDGQSAFIVGPKCKFIRKGFMGRYRYKKLRMTGSDRYAEKPDKNIWSHPHDALQYAAMETGIPQLVPNSDNVAAFGPSVARSIQSVNMGAWT